MSYKMTADGEYLIFEGVITVPYHLYDHGDSMAQERRELAAVTSQAFADCVYPPPTQNFLIVDSKATGFFQIGTLA